MSRFIAGLSLDRIRNYVSLAVVETFGEYQINRRYNLRTLERFKETSYGDVVNRALIFIDKNPFKGNTSFVVDVSSCKQLLIDVLSEVGFHSAAVTITEDDAATKDGSVYRVPKRELITSLQFLFIAERLRVNRDLPLGEIFIKELLNFRVQNIPETRENKASKGATHDDLVLAVALACWYGQKASEKEVRFR